MVKNDIGHNLSGDGLTSDVGLRNMSNLARAIGLYFNRGSLQTVKRAMQMSAKSKAVPLSIYFRGYYDSFKKGDDENGLIGKNK